MSSSTLCKVEDTKFCLEMDLFDGDFGSFGADDDVYHRRNRRRCHHRNRRRCSPHRCHCLSPNRNPPGPVAHPHIDLSDLARGSSGD